MILTLVPGSLVSRLQEDRKKINPGIRVEEICLAISTCSFDCPVASTHKVFRAERMRDQSSRKERKSAGEGGQGKRIECFLYSKSSPSLSRLLFTVLLNVKLLYFCWYLHINNTLRGGGGGEGYENRNHQCRGSLEKIQNVMGD